MMDENFGEEHEADLQLSSRNIFPVKALDSENEEQKNERGRGGDHE